MNLLLVKSAVFFCVVLVSGASVTYNENWHGFTELWFHTQVDHFGFANNDKFAMRYLVNDSYWRGDGAPIFFYTGNEGNIELFWNNTGLPFDLAPEFGAMIIFAEHRYYGKSQPFAKVNLSNPEEAGYLTSEQALADYADLLTHVRSQLPGASNSPVIAFGGSYGGMLAAWIRLKYPHVVQGSIAASAPVLQFTGLTPCLEFGKVVTRTFAKADANCPKIIRKSWPAIKRAMASGEMRRWLTENWHLCHTLSSSTSADDLIDWVTDIYVNLAMVDYPYPSNFLSPLPAYPVKVACSRVKQNQMNRDARKEDDKSLLLDVFSILEMYFNSTGEVTCLNTESQGTDSLDDNGWGFQACSEMVMPMCYNGVDDMFNPSEWDLEAYTKQCRREYGVTPRANMAQLIYGGRDIASGSNIIFSNGLLDPWSSGGIKSNISSSLIALIIPSGAHHLDLRFANADDPADVIWARQMERHYIHRWIDEYHHKRPRDDAEEFHTSLLP